MLSKEDFDEFAKKRFKGLIEKGENPLVVAGFIDYFGDATITVCSTCGIPVFVRPWLFQMVVEHNLKVVCLRCVDPKDLDGQLAMDLAKIDEETTMRGREARTSRQAHNSSLRRAKVLLHLPPCARCAAVRNLEIPGSRGVERSEARPTLQASFGLLAPENPGLATKMKEGSMHPYRVKGVKD